MSEEQINGTAPSGAPAVAKLRRADAVPELTGVLYTVYPGTNERTGWNIALAGPGHPKTQAQADRTERQRLNKAAGIERAQVNGRKWKGEEDKQPADARREFVSSLVERIVSWTPFDMGDGSITFDEGDPSAPERAINLFLKPEMGSYAAQIVDYLTAERAFIKGSAKT